MQIGQHYGLALDVTREELAGLDEARRYELILNRLAQHQIIPPGGGTGRDRLCGLLKVYQANMRAILGYSPSGPCAADIRLLLSESLQVQANENPGLGWLALTSGQVHTTAVPGDHFSLLREPHVQTVAALFAKLINENGCHRCRPSSADGTII